MSPSTITVVVPCAENEAVFLLHAVNAAIQAYRRSHVRSPEVPVEGSSLIKMERTSLAQPESIQPVGSASMLNEDSEPLHSQPIEILLVDDHPLVRQILRRTDREL